MFFTNFIACVVSQGRDADRPVPVYKKIAILQSLCFQP